MRKRLFVLLVLSLSLVLCLTSLAVEAKTYIRLATAGSGGNYYRLGAGMTTLWNEKLGEKVMSTIQATQGSPHNADLLADEQVELSFISASVLYDAYYNIGRFTDREKERYKDIRFLTFMYPNPQWFLAMEWAPEIKSIKDLKGKRVSVGMLGSNGEFTWQKIMKHLDWTYDDIVSEYTVHGSAIDQVRNRQIDALSWPDAPTSPSMTEILQTGFAHVVSIDEDIIKHMTENVLDFPYVIPAGTIEGQKTDMRTFASATILVAHKNVPDDIIYELMKTMFENKDYLVSVYSLANFIKLEDAHLGQPVPLHPGAKRYFEEVGILDNFSFK